MDRPWMGDDYFKTRDSREIAFRQRMPGIRSGFVAVVVVVVVVCGRRQESWENKSVSILSKILQRWLEIYSGFQNVLLDGLELEIGSN